MGLGVVKLMGGRGQTVVRGWLEEEVIEQGDKNGDGDYGDEKGAEEGTKRPFLRMAT